jgi:sulfatase modifying factor 1
MKNGPRGPALTFATLATALVALGADPVRADQPGAHPAYLRALSDLREARANEEKRAGDPQMKWDEATAVGDIDRAIADIKKAGVDDGKNLTDHPPVDAKELRAGRLHQALVELEKALSEVKEDNGIAAALRDRVVGDIDGAISFTKQGIAAASPSTSAQPSSSAGAASGATASCKAAMVSLPAGSFKPGDLDRAATVGAFCMDTTEVTVDAYTACVRAGKCSADHLGEWSTDGTKFNRDPKCNYGVAGRGNHPINCVDWQQADTYCRAEGKRLPSEEEWEWAARGATQARVYPWGGEAPAGQLCWSGVQKREGTCTVGSYPQGDAPGGIHDLAGNVWEWTSSSWDADHVYRGGSWHSEVAAHPRAAERSRGSVPYRLYFVGFRCVDR